MHFHKCHVRVVSLIGCASLALGALAAAPASASPSAKGKDPARQVLAANDGWAAAGSGTTGGADADASQVHTVTTWVEFKDALAKGGDAPKIIKVVGMLDATATATASGCAAFEADGYDFDQYLADYDPETWGYENPVSGEQEDLRDASAKVQSAAIKAFIPSNTTIIGVGKKAGITGASLQIKDVDNVILRNLTVESAIDCFPQWDPTDGSKGAWNSEYDAVVVYNATHVWLDHNTFTDGRYPDSAAPSYYGQLYQQHDGLIDIVRGADLVTVSWNVLKDHDKTMLIGNSDSEKVAEGDRGRLRVTLHHNLFQDLNERAPRVRFGQVDSYNNHFVATRGSVYGYSYGIGKESRLVAEHNAFTLAGHVDPARILKKWKDSPLTAENNYVNGRKTDLIAVHNAGVPDEQLTEGAGWTPALRTHVDHPACLPKKVRKGAGAGRLK
ncbi:pectate lyase family protein [Streptomyces apocyni]|uniref:pectate lyase family protein n=1 Tax=Streptomyces apocyni TaxID=2654677 RepID=UPI0012E99E79|nr:pectate lyase [Streptomyces apocyni]